MGNDLQTRLDEALSQVRVSAALRKRIVRAAQRKRAPRRLILAAALALALALAGAALASGEFLGSIDWWGRPQREEMEEPMPTPSNPEYEAHMANQALLDDQAHALLAGKPDGEYWKAGHAEGASLGTPSAFYDDYESFAQHLRASGAPMLLPIAAPEGYEFAGGQMDFYLPEKMARAASPYAVERHGEIELKKYRFDAALADCVAGYFLDYENAAGKRLMVWVSLYSESSGSMGFGVWEGYEYKTEEVPGMEAALFMRREGAVDTLYLYQTGLPPIEAMDFSDIGREPMESSRLDSATYDISADELDEEAMLAFARGLA